MKERFRIRWKDKGMLDWSKAYIAIFPLFIFTNLLALSIWGSDHSYAEECITAIAISWISILAFILIHLICSLFNGYFYLERVRKG